ncbi:MAG TPA: TetR family transcriptional regulator [Chloroflexia bacterium]|nr:TetR family transcriptional regulator [Chloroflexia bacterium]
MTATATQANETDPRVKRTRRLLLQAFSSLQKEKNINAISVQDIAERATVNRATFYAHFEDKYALMDGWMREEFRHMLASRLPADSMLTTHTLRSLITAVFDFLSGFYTTCKRSDTQFEPMFETAMQQELYSVLLSWLKHAPGGKSSPNAMEATALVVSWAIFGPAVQWSRGDRLVPADQITRDVMRVVVNALSGAVGSLA